MSPKTTKPRLTFGVEFEFSFAIVPNRFSHHPELDGETRIFRFEPTKEDIKSTDDCFTVTEKTIRAHISQTLTAAGHKCVDRNDAAAGYPTWEVKNDSTIEAPEGCNNDYKWFEIELTSPAFWFSEDSIRAVTDVLAIIKNTYLVNINESCGLHVHVGNGTDNLGEFRFSTIRNLYALLYAFEPQLDTLHPSHRQNGKYSQAFRNNTWKNDHIRILEPREGISAFLKCKNVDDLMKVTNIIPWGAYNFSHTVESDPNNKYKKKTIEFRQHEGTLDGDRVKAWIQTVVGLVQFAQDMEFRPDLFTDLLRVAKFEEIDEDRSRPRLCEQGFTVIDLLKSLGLWEAALFYKNRGLYGPHRPSYYYPTPPSSPLPYPKPIRPHEKIPFLEFREGEFLPG
jgi:hypothetical protein